MSSISQSVTGENYKTPHLLYSVGSKWPTYWPDVKDASYMGSATPGSSNDPRGYGPYIVDAHRAHSKGLYHSPETVISNAEPSMSILRFEATRNGVTLQRVSEGTLNGYNSIIAHSEELDGIVGAVLVSRDSQSIRGWVRPHPSSNVMDLRAKRVADRMQKTDLADKGVMLWNVGDEGLLDLPFLIDNGVTLDAGDIV